MLPLLDPSRHKAVCYHDTASRAWVVLDRTGRALPLAASPVSARECFALYDEARCRGADLQLRRDAVGLLTLGPGLCKDKLMQAAGRMRLLGRGQTVQFVGAPDVMGKVRQAAAVLRDGVAGQRGVQGGGGGSGGAVDSRAVLQWAMGNTVAATEAGLLPWAAQGLHFAASRGVPERAVQDELLELYDMYGGSKVLRPVGEVVGERAAAQLRLCAVADGGSTGAAGTGLGSRGLQLKQQRTQLMHDIARNAAEYGEGHQVPSGGGGGAADEECERELEQEEEEEEEVERQVPRAKAVQEADWSYGTVLRASSVQQLDAAAYPVQLASVVQRLLAPDSLGGLPWCPEVYGTRNFVVAVSLPEDQQVPGASSGNDGAAKVSMNEYLRQVDAVLLFPPQTDGGGAAAGPLGVGAGAAAGAGAGWQLLLVSEREADQLVAVMRRGAGGGAGAGASAGGGRGPVLMSLCYAHAALVGENGSTGGSTGSGHGGGGGSPGVRRWPLACSSNGGGAAEAAALVAAAATAWPAGAQSGGGPQAAAGLAQVLASAMVFNGDTTFTAGGTGSSCSAGDGKAEGADGGSRGGGEVVRGPGSGVPARRSAGGRAMHAIAGFVSRKCTAAEAVREDAACDGGELLLREVRGLVAGAREEVEVLVGMRGKGVLLPRSELEGACSQGPEGGASGAASNRPVHVP